MLFFESEADFVRLFRTLLGSLKSVRVMRNYAILKTAHGSDCPNACYSLRWSVGDLDEAEGRFESD